MRRILLDTLKRCGRVAIILGLCGSMCALAACEKEKKEPVNASFELETNQAAVMGDNISKLPDRGLVDENGNPFSFSQIVGHTSIITFLYTNCPRSKECPLLVKKLKAVQKKLLETDKGNYRMVIFTVDPRRDTPSTLKKFAEEKGFDAEHTVLVTGANSTLEELAAKFAISLKGNPLDKSFNHDVRTYMANPKGVVAHGLRTSKWKPEVFASLLLTNMK